VACGSGRLLVPGTTDLNEDDVVVIDEKEWEEEELAFLLDHYCLEYSCEILVKETDETETDEEGQDEEEVEEDNDDSDHPRCTVALEKGKGKKVGLKKLCE